MNKKKSDNIMKRFNLPVTFKVASLLPPIRRVLVGEMENLERRWANAISAHHKIVYLTYFYNMLNRSTSSLGFDSVFITCDKYWFKSGEHHSRNVKHFKEKIVSLEHENEQNLEKLVFALQAALCNLALQSSERKLFLHLSNPQVLNEEIDDVELEYISIDQNMSQSEILRKLSRVFKIQMETGQSLCVSTSTADKSIESK